MGSFICRRSINVPLPASLHCLLLAPERSNLLREEWWVNRWGWHGPPLSLFPKEHVLCSTLQGKAFSGLGLLGRNAWLGGPLAHKNIPHSLIPALTIIKVTCWPPPLPYLWLAHKLVGQGGGVIYHPLTTYAPPQPTQMKKLSLRDVKGLVQVHIATKWLSLSWTGSVQFKPHILNLCIILLPLRLLCLPGRVWCKHHIFPVKQRQGNTTNSAGTFGLYPWISPW